MERDIKINRVDNLTQQSGDPGMILNIKRWLNVTIELNTLHLIVVKSVTNLQN